MKWRPAKALRTRASGVLASSLIEDFRCERAIRGAERPRRSKGPNDLINLRIPQSGSKAQDNSEIMDCSIRV